MPRRNRHTLRGVAFHVMNRAVRGTTIFRTNGDFDAFAAILRDGLKRTCISTKEHFIAFSFMEALLSYQPVITNLFEPQPISKHWYASC